MAQKIINGKTARDFTSSAAAEAWGFRVIDWLRAFSFNEHAARIDADRALPRWWEAA
jgi:hypothetical protein